ncbi:hypothetical protein [Microbacterium sp. UBA837]|uniref:hypothetical protein n=1 Tax=Microbacterium sp. UBA837 TaxID=1946956 RepID=UPI0025ED7520|nr:hypothetical protein [Microbacterium sp. UBA837]
MSTETKHAEHVKVDAYAADCLEGECEHVNEWGEGDLELCPVIKFDTCIDCMDEAGAGRDPEGWEEWPLNAWPHPGSAGWTETAPEPRIFKESL